jgi:ATP-dependent RNA helicase RhlB
VTGEELAPRKRRRRRRGKPVEGATAESASGTTPATPRAERTPRPPRHDPRPARAPGEAPAATGESKPGLFGRVARGLKSLITRAPRSQH